MKYLRDKFGKYLQKLYTNKCQDKSKKTLINGETFYVLWSEHSLF